MPRPPLSRPAVLLGFLLPVLPAALRADPQLTAWSTANSGKYARVYTTTANRTSGTSATTWNTSGTTLPHTLPAYADVYEIWYSNSWVYTKYTGLPSYVTGPWLNPQGAVGNFWPGTQSVIRRFPRSPSVQSGTKDSTAAGTSGIFVNGVAAFNSLDGQAWDGSQIQGQAQHTNGTYYWHRVAPVAESYNFDYALGHQLPAGLYHNHQNPIALRYQLGDHVDFNTSTKNYSESATAVTAHSPILGYAHDGYPIYGPYGYGTATNSASGVRRMVSGFVKRNGGTTGVDTVTSNTTTMPAWYLRYRSAHNLGGTTNPVSVARSTNTTTYPIGTFAQDWAYLGDLIKTGSTAYAQGTDFDLDEYNGRYCVTPEYPSGTYAYFVATDSSGAATYPYVFNFEFYGNASGGTVSSISESVTNYFTGGAGTALAIPNTPTVANGTVSLTWNSVEGGTYSVEASTNQSTWTSKATGLSGASNATSTSTTYTALGGSGTEYARVQRTALASYDVPSVASTVTTAQSATKSYLAGANTAPTLTTVSTLSGAVKNTAFTISYDTLAAAANEADAEGDSVQFRIEGVSSGALTKSGTAVTAGVTTLATGESMVWTPATDVTGTVAAFTVKAYDGALASGSAVTVNVSISATAPADAQLTSWYTARTGRYARIVETDTQLLADTTKTTWTRTSGPNTTAQTSPAYAGPQQVDYSASWVYLRTPSLGTYTMGPWYNDSSRSDANLFVSLPKNQGYLVRFPRSSTLGAIPTTKTSTSGLNVGGVMQPGCGFLVDGVCIFDPTDGFSYSGGTEASPGTGSWHRDAYANEFPTMDKSNAHQQNTGVYHNHLNPIALRYQLGDNVTFNSTTKTYSEGDTSAPAAHSPVIGWMLDGLPVYGPYGYSSAMDSGSGVRRMIGGFVLRNGATTGVDNLTSSGRTVPAWATRNGVSSVNGPAVSTTYPLGRYVEDYAYLGDLIKSGSTKYQQGVDFDLNEYNVRYCVTPEFPNGTWAYFLNISSTGASQFPYMINRWFYGTPTGGTVTSVAETVTNQFSGGANRPLAVTDATAAGTSVTLTWNAVEGGTYSVDASTNNSTWTSKATGLTVSNANSKSNTHTALGTSGTEYARVNRTALATYDSTGTVAATVSQTAGTSFNLVAVNAAPTLTTIGALGGAVEDTPFTISYATLAAAADEADSNGDAMGFRIEAVSSGTLVKNGVAVTAGVTLLSSGESLVWTPPANANGTDSAFTVKAWDGALASSTAVPVNVTVAAVNDTPTLTSIQTLTGATEDTAFNVSFVALAAASDAVDADGPFAFRVESVTSGTLTKGGVAVTPGETTLATGESLVWTPAANENGVIAAFTVRAYDGTVASSDAITVNFNVAAVTDGAIWSGGAGTGEWVSSGNWVDRTVPTGWDTAQFTGAAPYAITLGESRNITSLSFLGDHAYTISQNTLTLHAGVLGTSDPSSGSLTHVIASAFSFDGALTASIAANAPLELTGGVSGDQAWTKTGAGTLTLTGASTYHGTLTISAGTVELGKTSGGTEISGALDQAVIVNHAALVSHPPASFAGTIRGSGSWTVHGGGGTAVFTGSATHTGGTTLENVQLTLGNGGTGGSLGGTIQVQSGSSLTFNRSDALTVTSPILGEGNVSHRGAGVLTMASSVTTGQLSIGNGATLDFTGSLEAGGLFVGEANAPGILNASGDAGLSATTVWIGAYGNGALHLSDGADLIASGIRFGDSGSGSGILTVSGAGTTLECGGIIQAVDATSSLTISDGAEAILSAVNTVPVTIDNATATFSKVSNSNAPITIASGGATIAVTNDSTAQSGGMSGPGTLTKTCNGVLILRGDSTRTGDTYVEAGSIDTDRAVFPDNADVHLAAGAYLTLGFTGGDTIDELYLDGVKQKAGTWGAVGSGATFTSGYFSGTGVLVVTGGEVTFQGWAGLQGLDGSPGKESGANDDPDKDGVPNSLEFVLGGDPLAGSPNVLPTVTASGGYLTLRFYRNDASESHVALSVQTSTDLSSWTSYAVGAASGTENGVIVTVTEMGDSPDLITVAVPIGSNKKLFSRLVAATD